MIGFIEGSNYPPPLFAQYVAQLTSLLWISGIVILVAGDSVLSMIGAANHPLHLWVKNNKMMTFGALFMLNNIGANMLTTGAFEIYYNGDLVFSRLHERRFPVLEELAELLITRGAK